MLLQEIYDMFDMEAPCERPRKVLQPKKDFRVVLVAPPADFISELYGFRTRRSYRNQPPLGIGYIASFLRSHGFSITLLDCAANGWDIETAVRQILSAAPDVIGITAITFESAAAFALARQLKRQSGAFVVLGGAHANSYFPLIPEQCPELDAIVAGDGETIMLELCRRLSEARTLEAVPGLRYKQPDGGFSIFVEADPIMDLDALPPPAYDLYPHHLYRPLPHRAKRLPSGCMITSRGCSYAQCTYCELSGLIRKTYRRHSPQRVVQEMKMLKEIAGVKEIYFQDDIFISEQDWVAELCNRMISARLDLFWSCESRFQGLSKALLERMRQAGCWRIYYGFESGSQRLLDKIKKGFTLEEARLGVRLAKEAGLDVVGFFMLGLPSETPEDGRKTIDFSLSLGLDHAIYTLTVPHPNTELYALCQNEGTLLEGNQYYYKTASFVPLAYQNAAQLEALRNEAFRRFYYRPAYWWRCLKGINNLVDLKYYVRGFISLFSYLD